MSTPNGGKKLNVSCAWLLSRLQRAKFHHGTRRATLSKSENDIRTIPYTVQVTYPRQERIKRRYSISLVAHCLRPAARYLYCVVYYSGLLRTDKCLTKEGYDLAVAKFMPCLNSIPARQTTDVYMVVWSANLLSKLEILQWRIPLEMQTTMVMDERHVLDTRIPRRFTGVGS